MIGIATIHCSGWLKNLPLVFLKPFVHLLHFSVAMAAQDKTFQPLEDWKLNLSFPCHNMSILVHVKWLFTFWIKIPEDTADIQKIKN